MGKYHSEGKKFFEAGDYEKAVKSFDKAIKHNDEVMWSWFDKGKVLVQLGNYSEAENCFKEAKKIDENNTWVYSQLGRIYYYQGEEAKSKKYYQKALELDPKNHEAIEGLDRLGRIPPELDREIHEFIEECRLIAGKGGKEAYYVTETGYVAKKKGIDAIILGVGDHAVLYLGMERGKVRVYEPNAGIKMINPKDITSLLITGKYAKLVGREGYFYTPFDWRYKTERRILKHLGKKVSLTTDLGRLLFDKVSCVPVCLYVASRTKPKSS